MTPLGIGVDATWNAAIAGQSGVRRITRFDAERVPVADRRRGARRARPVATCPRRRRAGSTARSRSRSSRRARRSRARSSRSTTSNCERIGVSVGSGIGGLETIEQGVDVLAQSGSAPRAAVRDSDDDLQHDERLPRDPPRAQGPEPLPRQRVRDRRALDRRGGARDRARRRGRDAGRRHRGAGDADRAWRASPRCARSRRATTSPRARAARSTASATAS